MKNTISIIALTLFMSCSVTKDEYNYNLKKGTLLTQTKLTRSKKDGLMVLKVDVYKLEKCEKAKVEIKDNAIAIKLENKLKKPKTFIDKNNYGTKDSEFTIPYEFAHSGLFKKLRNSVTIDKQFDKKPFKPVRKIKNGEFIHQKLTYFQNSKKLQALTIPFKIRPSIDTFEYQVSTGINVGFGVAFKRRNFNYTPITSTKIGSVSV